MLNLFLSSFKERLKGFDLVQHHHHHQCGRHGVHRAWHLGAASVRRRQRRCCMASTTKTSTGNKFGLPEGGAIKSRERISTHGSVAWSIYVKIIFPASVNLRLLYGVCC